MNVGAVCVALTILLTVYGQIVLKWQIGGQTLPEATQEKIKFLFSQLLNPWVITAFVAAFGASLTWMAAMTKLKLSDAYPFMSLAFVIVMFLSWPIFGEAPTANKVCGTVIVICGLILINR